MRVVKSKGKKVVCTFLNEVSCAVLEDWLEIKYNKKSEVKSKGERRCYFLHVRMYVCDIYF